MPLDSDLLGSVDHIMSEGHVANRPSVGIFRHSALLYFILNLDFLLCEFFYLLCLFLFLFLFLFRFLLLFLETFLDLQQGPIQTFLLEPSQEAIGLYLELVA